jgi:hypothetical protein
MVPSTTARPIGSFSPVATFLYRTLPGLVFPVTRSTMYTSPSVWSLPPQVAITSRPSRVQSIADTCGSKPFGRRSVSV